MSMTDKEKADCLLELHKGQLDHFAQTRDIEFKVNLALWTLIAATGSFLYGKVCFNDSHSLIFYIIIASIVFVVHLFCWMIPIGKSQGVDDYFVNRYRCAVEHMVGDVGMPASKQDREKRKSKWQWIAAESGITLMLLVTVGLVLSVG